MAVDYTTTALLASIRRRGMIPNNSEVFSDADLLALATEELQSFVVPFLLRIREEYLVAVKDVTIVSGTAEYDIPARAIGGKLRDVLVLLGNDYVPIPRVEPEQVVTGPSGSVGAYYLQNNQVVLVPTPSSGGTLRLKYHRRPSELVAVSACQSITDASAGTGTYILAVSGSAISGSVDVVRGTPGFDVLAADAADLDATAGVVEIATTSFTAMPGDTDYVTPAGQSCVVQLPVELHPLLVQRVVAKVLEAKGDKKAAQAFTVCDAMLKDAHSLLAPRSEGSPRYLVNRNAPGFIRGRRG